MAKDLDEILSGEPAQVEQATVETPEPVAPATPEPEAQPAPVEPEAGQQPAEERQGGMVPHKALHASRERARTAEERAAELERQMAEMRGQVSVLTQQRQQPAPQPAPEPPKPVDFWEDPNKFVEAALTPVQQQLAETRFELSMQRAITSFGEDSIKTAEAAIRDAIARGELDSNTVTAQLGRSRDPVGDIVRWHQQQPASVEARIRAEIEAKVRAELAGQQPEPTLEQPPNPTPAVMPSNLVGQRNVGPRSGPAWSGPAPLNDIFDRSRQKKAG